MAKSEGSLLIAACWNLLHVLTVSTNSQGNQAMLEIFSLNHSTFGFQRGKIVFEIFEDPGKVQVLDSRP